MGYLCLILLLSAGAALGADAPWPTQGWATSTPEEQGMDSALLERADEFIRTQSPNRYSFLVVRNGYLVFERYYRGAAAESRFQIASITKSFISALTGIAVERGLVRTEDRFFDIFPEYTGVGDSRLDDLRVEHMLTMSGGLLFDEVGGVPAMTATRNWVRWVIEQPMDHAPGESFRYNSGLTHVLSAVLQRKTGMSTREFAVRNLLGPLGIYDFGWGYDWQLIYFGGWGMDVNARDLAKFGYLYLHDGMWDGRQVVPAAWVRDSVAPHIRHNIGADDFYGYLFWMDNHNGFFIPSASGAGSQRIWYSRELNLVVVTTSETSGPAGDIGRLMTDYVLPSVFHGEPRINAGGLVGSAAGRRPLAPDSFASIYGENLAPAEVSWATVIVDGKTLPTTLGGVSVRIAGRECYPSYAGPNQVNVLLPADLPVGEAELELRHAGGMARTTVTIAPAAPALFNVATFAGEVVYVAEPGAIPGAQSRPARRGDNIALYVNGLGATAAGHPAGEALPAPLPHSNPASIRVLFGDLEASPQAVNMTYAGVWQVNVQVPDVPAGRLAVVVRAGGETAPAIFLPIVR